MKTALRIAFLYLILVASGRFPFALDANVATSSLYLEDLLLSLEQNSSALAYNVTMVQQCEPAGSGPFYSMAGLITNGYWYHFGVGWNWPSGLNPFTPSQGFRAIFDVWNANSAVFSADDSLNSVHGGDIVQLSMSFSGGDVTMRVYDWNTTTTDQQSYSAMGATQFEGNANNAADSNGGFTGLLTREYHQTTYFGDEQSVVYRTSNGLSSAWVRIVEFSYPSKSPVVFDDYASYNYANQSQLQSFHSNGAFVASNANQFVTGSLTTGLACPSPANGTILQIIETVILIGGIVAVIGVIFLTRRYRASVRPQPFSPSPSPL